MKKALTVIIISTMVVGIEADLGAVTIDFEGLDYTMITGGGNKTPNPPSVVTSDFMSDGVLFGKPGVSTGIAVVRDSFGPSSGLNSAAGLDAAGILPGTSSGSCVGDIFFSFVLPGTLTLGETDYVSFTIGDTGGDLDIFEIRSYNLVDTLFDTQNVSNASRFPVTISLSGIHRVEVDFSGDYGYSLDDLSFTTPVPEPMTICLLGLGSLLLRRRRA